ncbi:MAG TPA: hypothetical protein VE058_14630 [Steroidobacteraceae bacterium]|nr:hypothetical protein [Steroidobacteraceae bacterium]
MKESNRRRAARCAAAATVLAVHLVLIAVLIMMSRTAGITTATANAVQVLFVAPVFPPKEHVMANLPRRGRNLAVTVEPPLLESLSFPASRASGSSANGEGSGVDWAAEARRALQAFEIRNHQPSASRSVSGRPEDDHWRPHAQHHAGERFKTENGDWMVWIDANCYEIARAGSGAYAHVAPLTEPICQDQPGAAIASHQ